MKRARKIIISWHTSRAHDGVPYYHLPYEECCDCGLIHRVKIESVDKRGRIIRGVRHRLTVWRVKGITKENRRKRSIVVS